MAELPTGVVTFLFTDIEGSTRLVRELGDAFAAPLTAHQAILRDAAAAGGGVAVRQEGDGGLFAFGDARRALEAALEAQRSLHEHPWDDGASVKVRMGLHTGAAATVPGDYVGLAVHVAARICDAGHGGQVLVSDATRSAAGEVAGARFDDLGSYQLRGMTSPERLYQVTRPGLADSFPPLRTLKIVPNNLPSELTSFVGRDGAVAELGEQLRSTRLVTLTGPGGCGKTRIALRVARDRVDHHDDGSWIVDLSALTEPDGTVEHVAWSIGALDARSADDLVSWLAGKDLLLVLDNCEHLVEPVGDLVVHLLRRCDRVRILCTSREPLAVEGESVWGVPSLDVPPADVDDAERVSGFDAVRLFAERTAARRRGFVVDASNAAAVAEICRALDGIPLAIELAAARAGVVGPAEVAARLGDRLTALRAGRGSVPRHRTLESTVRWSYDLLGPHEQRLFRRLGVFAGWFTADAVAAVCAVDGDPVESLVSLVERSLVQASDDAEPRYRLLETVRLFATGELVAAGEEEDLQDRHLSYIVDLAERTAPSLTGPEQAALLGRLDSDIDNVRAAMSHALDAGRQHLAHRIAAALEGYWQARGLLSEGRRWTAGPWSRDATGAHALDVAGQLAAYQGDYDDAASALANALEIRLELGDAHGEAETRRRLGGLWWLRGDYEGAERELTRALAGFDTVGDRLGTARAKHNLATVASLRDTARSRELFAEALAVRRELGDSQGTAETLNNLGILSRLGGDYAAARRFGEEALAIARSLGHRPYVAAFVGNLGIVAEHEGDLETARVMFSESLAVRRELGDREGEAIALNSMGVAALLDGDAAAALGPLEESLAIRRDLGDRRGVAESLNNLGTCFLDAGAYDRARACLDESLSMRRELDDRQGTASTLYTLGRLCIDTDDHASAHRVLSEALTTAAELGAMQRVVGVIVSLARVAAATGRDDAAAVLLGVAGAVRDSTSLSPSLDATRTADELEGELRERLGADAFGAAVELGRNTPVDGAVELVATLAP